MLVQPRQVHYREHENSGERKFLNLTFTGQWISLSIILLLCLIKPVIAQTYYFDNYSVSEGLGQSTVFKIIQDSRHVLWIGTQSGVSRFDGRTFENLSKEEGLALNGVRAIFEDSRKMIWLGHSGGGLTRWSPEGFEVITVLSGTIKGNVTSIAEDKQGKIWITTDGSGAYKISNPSASAAALIFTHYKGDKLSDRIFGSSLSAADSIFFVTDIGIKLINSKDNSFSNFAPQGLTTYWTKTCILEDSEGNIWFGTYHGGLYKYIKSENRFKVYDIRDGLSFNWISTLFEDSQANIWAGTWGGGITRINKDGLKAFTTSNGLPDDKIWCITEDAEGNILIGTNEHGLSIFKGERFSSISQKDGLKDPQVWAINQDKSGKYWFGTNNGISIFNPAADRGKRFSSINENSHPLNSTQIRAISHDSKGRMWIATYNGGINMYDPNSAKFTYYPELHMPGILPTDLIITGMVIDKKDRIWLGTVEGLAFFDPVSRKGDRLTISSGLPALEVTSIFCDSKGALWVGLRGAGISKQVSDSLRFVSVDTLKSITPKCFAEDTKGNLWIGTEGQGIFVFNGHSVSRHISEKDGLLANLINLLICDKTGNVYIGTNKGLNKYDNAGEKIYTYTRKNGFTGIETKENSAYLDLNGNLWFGTVAGAMEYFPQMDFKRENQPLTDIKSIRINYAFRKLEPNLVLKYSENNVIFDFQSICLTNPEAVAYQVMLKGADPDWQPVTQQPMVSYPSLPPRKYTFMVRARNSEGTWNKEPVIYSFQIKPPFYKTWWFIMLCIVSGILLIILYIAIRERNLVRDKKNLEMKVQERTLEVTLKNEELAMKNKDITDSLHYAQRLQFAMLLPYIPFPEAFIIFKPKDIVSGDFYWILTGNNKEFLAAVDCTGHGVPGAFMSFLAFNSLNKIVKEYHITEPSNILEHLNMEVTLSLHQQGDKTEINDGMDIALVCYNRETKMLSYAGAFNPLYLIRNGKLNEFKADRFPIGRQTPADSKFTNHEMEIFKGDVIYIFSDGFADQLGAGSGKKFKLSRIKELLLSIQHLPMNEQKKYMEDQLEQWMGDMEQIDDILFIGRRF
jgi:ligand-binding sensor domain-containing protein/serine phosphatase RsbU (regulator of sigma subunit)